MAGSPATHQPGSPHDDKAFAPATDPPPPPTGPSGILAQPDLALSANPPTSIAPQMTSLFPHESAQGLLPMHFSPPTAATPLNITPMDILATSKPPALPQQHEFQPDLGFRTQHSSPANSLNTPPSTSPPHVAHSPGHMQDLASSFTANTSSLSSALDGTGVPRAARSDASSSPIPLNSSGSELAFSSISSGPPTSTPGSSAYIPSPGSQVGSADTAMDQDPHLLAVGGILKNIEHVAQSAQKACADGRGNLAQARIAELKARIALVSQLIEATRLDDGHTPVATTSSAGMRTPPGLDASATTTTTVSPNKLQQGHVQYGNGASGFSGLTPSDSMSAHGSPDTSESRKRCASSRAVDGDRVVKAMKLEPQQVTIPSPPPSAQASDYKQPSSFQFSPTLHADNTVPVPSFAPSSSANANGINLVDLSQRLVSAQSSALPGAEFPPASPASLHFSSHPLPSMHPAAGWPDRPHVLQHRHTLSGSSLNGSHEHYGIAGAPAPLSFTSPGSFGHPPIPLQSPLGPLVGDTSRPHLNRQTRSMSVTGPAPSPFAFGLPDATMTGNSRPERPRPSTSSGRSGLAARSRFSSAETDDSDSDSEASPSMSHHQSKSPSRDRSMSRSRPRAGQTSRPSTSHGLQSRASVENVPGAHGNEVPQEYRAEVDRIFFEFLTRICSDLDATDSKGEPIHQTLMAKKMQRLDESPDFRPFKFRIAAFTNAFLEELARQGYPEEIIPMKKIRNYLWNQSYISRFNEEGKKTKSKGNHIWSIDAKKTADGGWTFRPFHRRLAGNPPSVAYVGLRWSWHPRIWDPQNSRLNLPVIYSSPSLPSWLSWEDDVLSGIPPPDAESCDVTVEARFVQDGQEETLSQTVHVNIAPMSNVDAFPAMRRPSLSQTADGDPRRIASEANAISGPLRPLLRAEPAVPPPALAAPKRETQVMQVLASAAQRVAQEAQSQVIASSFVEPGPELHALAKQQHVLTVTAQAVDNEMSGRMDGPQQQSTVLAAAAQHVVFQAAMQVAADRAEAVANQISAGMIPAQSEPAQVTVNDVSMATQTAVAQAVELTGPLSSEVDVLMTASSLLQQQQGRVPLATAPVLDRPMAPAAPHLIPSTSIPPPVFPPAASF